MRTLVTVTPPFDYPGAVPTEPVGRALVAELLRRDVASRVLAPPGTGGWPRGVELVHGDLAHWQDLPDVFDGVDAVLLAGADPATLHGALAHARSRGVAKVVTLSSHGPDVEIALPPEHWHWLAVEVLVERSGMAWANVVPSAVMASTLTGAYPLAVEPWGRAIAEGRPLRVPYADAPVPVIHEQDLAEVLALVLLGDELDGRRVGAAGRPVSAARRVRALRAATGLPVRLDEVGAEDAPAVLRGMGVDEHAAEHLLSTLRWFQEHHDESYRDTERLLGRPLRDFADWAREHATAIARANGAGRA